MLKTLKRFLQLFRDVPTIKLAGLLFLMILASLSEGIGILMLVPMLEVLDGGQVGDNQVIQWLVSLFNETGLPLTIGGLLTVFLLLVIFRSVVQYGQSLFSIIILHQLVDRLRQRCFSSLLRAEWRWLATGRKSDHATLLLTDVNRVGMGFNFTLQLLTTAITIAAYLLAAFALSWKMTALALISGSLVFLLLSGQRRKALLLGEGLTRANQAMHGNIQESLAGIKLAKILGNEKRHLDLFRRVMTRLRQQQISFTASSGLSQGLFQIVGALLLAGYLYTGLTLWSTPVAELLILVLIFSRLIPMFSSTQQNIHHLLHVHSAVEQIDQLLEQSKLAAEPIFDGTPASWPVEQDIRLDEVTIQYCDRDTAALDKVSIRFPARTTTAIMGVSGAGKSTLADLLMGLLKPDQGVMCIDGETVEGDKRLRWRRSVAYVPQDNFLFNDTIRNNLLWGNPAADEKELKLALQRAAADFVFSLPQQLDTQVGDGGIRLSGGERQRLALARALLKRPSLLILDEATSALDMDNEARVRAAIENLHGDLTVVIIGHRIATLEHADQVAIMDSGRISAQGSWEEVKEHMVIHHG